MIGPASAASITIADDPAIVSIPANQTSTTIAVNALDDTIVQREVRMVGKTA